MSKIGLKPIFRAYVNTLRDNSTGKLSFFDIAVQIIVPVAVGIIVALLIGKGVVSKPSFDSLITVVSIVSSLLCALALMLFSLRSDMAKRRDEAQPTALELQLIDELFADVMWCVVAGFAAALFMTVSAMTETFPFCIEVFATAFSIMLLLNFALVACMCLKRMNAVYAIVSHARQGRGNQ